MDPDDTVREVLVVTKTHLDVGFTAPAADVLDHYLDSLVPGALATAAALRAESGDAPRLCWTVGSWLVVEALERADRVGRSRLVEAVERGELAWHAWPFTTHTALLDVNAVRHALAMSAWLDERFGTRTVAAKMTDVPGQPRSLVPLLAEGGVTLLHLGANPASSTPETPPVFRWLERRRGAEVVVVHQRGAYGGVQRVPGTDVVLVVEHAGDNQGPPTADDVRRRWHQLAQRFPGARLRAARLDDAWHALAATPGAVQALPVVTDDLGDTWIHGAASDPRKVAGLRAVLRELTDRGDEHEPCSPAWRSLLLVAEHTWGLDVKTHYPDTTTWSPAALAAERAEDGRVTRLEASWSEQRDLLARAAAELGCVSVLEAGVPVRDDLAGAVAVRAGEPVIGRHATVVVDPVSGALRSLRTVAGEQVAGRSHPVGEVTYQTYSAAELDRWYDEYVVAGPDDEWWARADQTKPGLTGASARRWRPRLQDLWRFERGAAAHGSDGVRLVACVGFAAGAVRGHGAPAELRITYDLPDDDPVVHVTLDWFAKPADRRPEALWFRFHPKVVGPGRWMTDVLGSPQAPDEVVCGGGRHLQAVGRGVAWIPDPGRTGDGLTIESLDAAVVAPGEPLLARHLCDHPSEVGRFGWHWLLFDNLWGTNFPQWSLDADARFRFAVRWSSPSWWDGPGAFPDRVPRV